MRSYTRPHAGGGDDTRWIQTTCHRLGRAMGTWGESKDYVSPIGWTCTFHFYRYHTQKHPLNNKTVGLVAADDEGKENTFLSTDFGRFGGYPLGNWLAKHFPEEDEGIKLYIDLSLVAVTKVRIIVWPRSLSFKKIIFRSFPRSRSSVIFLDMESCSRVSSPTYCKSWVTYS